MAKVRQPENIEIAALKKKVVQQSNLMQAGPGTPWEDRGSLGTFKAFFLTCIKSLTAPGELWSQIRRPETTGDATWFAVWCGAIAGISWIVHSLAWDMVYSGFAPAAGVPPLLVRNDDHYVIDWQTWAFAAALQMTCAIGGTLLLLRFANFLYQKLLPHGIASRIPSALSYNILAYALGPVLLSLIPCYGWVLALLWFLILVILASTKRLSLGAGTAVVSGILTVVIVSAVGFGAYFAGAFGWSYLTGTAVTYYPPPKPHDLAG
jgi:hypothetical protein